jgi:hypothetical protein
MKWSKALTPFTSKKQILRLSTKTVSGNKAIFKPRIKTFLIGAISYRVNIFMHFSTSGKANSWFADIYFQSVVNISLENSSRIYPSLFTNF